MKKSNKIAVTVDSLKAGGIGVMPTDTIFGLLGSALKSQTVARIYKLKRRAKNKPSIILISGIEDLELFDIKVTKSLKNKLTKFWPGPNSLIIKNTAFRVPKPVWLRKLLAETGPLIAPSANPESAPPARSVAEAKKYFGNKVDFYLAGKTGKKASNLIKFDGKKVVYLR